MRIVLPYNQDAVSVDLAKEKCAGVIFPNKLSQQVTDDATILNRALLEPAGSVTFSQFIEGDDEILILVNDATRPTPTARMLEIIGQQLSFSRCRFLVATGSHRQPTQQELKWIFGDLFESINMAGHIHCHDAKADDEICFLGKSPAGTEINLNKLLVQASKVMIITTVEPHYFAGFTGGRKSFLPGVASYESIRQNHSLALQSGAANLILQGNPVHEDLDSCLTFLKDKQIFAVQAVLDQNHNIYSVHTGNIKSSFQEATQSATDVFCVDIPEKVDIIVSVARYPMDIDLYQSLKALENAKPALKPGGIIILLSSCRDGIGSPAFFNLLSSCDKPEAVYKIINDKYLLGYHKAAKLADACANGHIWAVTDLPAEILEKVFIRSWNDIQSAVNMALSKAGNGSKVLFIPEGSITVPRIISENSQVF